MTDTAVSDLVLSELREMRGEFREMRGEVSCARASVAELKAGFTAMQKAAEVACAANDCRMAMGEDEVKRLRADVDAVKTALVKVETPKARALARDGGLSVSGATIGAAILWALQQWFSPPGVSPSVAPATAPPAAVSEAAP